MSLGRFTSPYLPKKSPPRPEILDSQNLPPKCPENTEKNTPQIPKMPIWGTFSVFSGCFLVVPEFRAAGVFFRYFSWKFRVGPSRGSVAGRGVLKTREGCGSFWDLLGRF